ncbi:MAG: PSD1 domain-containing protein [Planctomycetaceae bacterium]|nr:PSD1 domain-containing protein [Planctomycetaceae bacterium]
MSDRKVGYVALASFVFTALLSVVLPATEPSVESDGERFFFEKIEPLMKRHCYECHSHAAAAMEGGLTLDSRLGWAQGGASGPAIVPGKPDESLLIKAIRRGGSELQMPPDEKLPNSAVEQFVDWIQRGAPDPRKPIVRSIERNPLDWWSLRTLNRPEVPTLAAGSVADANPIDAFVSRRLHAEGLSSMPLADRRTLVRRVYFDLHGLPPTPEEVEAFVYDPDPRAYEKLVDTLLESQRYGERWARHWLDTVHFADSHGCEHDVFRPNAWRYRDYVISSFNRDTPWARFIREQLAVDRFFPDEPQLTPALGFIAAGPLELSRASTAPITFEYLDRDDMVTQTMSAFASTTANCARCHDHKFDPISQEDYSMQAFLSGVQYGERRLLTAASQADRLRAEELKQRVTAIDRELSRYEPLAHPNARRPAAGEVPADQSVDPLEPHQQTPPRRSTVTALQNIDRFRPVATRRVRFTILATNSLEPCVDELEIFNLEGRNVALASGGAVATCSPGAPDNDRHRLQHINDGRYGNGRSWMSGETGGGWVEITFARPEQIDCIHWARDREGKFSDRLAIRYQIEAEDDNGELRVIADSTDRTPWSADGPATPTNSVSELSASEAAQAAALQSEKKELLATVSSLEKDQMVFAGYFTAPEVTRLLVRGDPEQPRGEVAPAVLSALGSLQLPANSGEQERRLALANWIASADNPLTSRVLVNRIWQWHFGTGLVATSSDFGHSGAVPSHPELLDWLAAEFVRSGWSIKSLHRLIMMSSTYAQSSRIDSTAQAVDADTRLLWRFPSRRLEAEAIRDGMLAVSGRLNLKMGGSGFDLFRSRGGLSGFPPIESFDDDGRRRMIYAHKIRMEREIVFGAFDCPDAGQTTARRRQSTTPIQALNLFNSQFTIDEARAFADQVREMAGQAPSAQIVVAWNLALGRDPEADEQAAALQVSHQFGLEMVCRVLFNTNEFLFLP